MSYDHTSDVVYLPFIYDPCDLQSSFFGMCFSLQGKEKQGSNAKVADIFLLYIPKSLTINNTELT
jgi:hypothetical protein